MLDLAKLTEIVESHTYDELPAYDGGPEVVVDVVTANMLLTVHDALNDENKAKFASMPLAAAVELGWKLVT